ncbi:MAG: hypothetical protein ACLU8C_00770 [Lacrimispora saccharolytica]|nr:hypothetical protein [Lachnospiraceae bacterium]
MFNEKPMPFYMSGSMSFEKERDEVMEREWRILKSWYSGEILQVQEAVERACDELDYEGSWLYDEYPDRGRMEEMQEKIQRELERDGEAAVEAEERRRRRRGDNLLKVLLSNEIFRRRCRNRNCRRHFW